MTFEYPKLPGQKQPKAPKAPWKKKGPPKGPSK